MLHEELVGLGPDGRPSHSTALLVEIERAVAAAGGWEAIGRIAVGRGPGSFVGIRIGIATARGLAASTGLPVVGVCTLDALGRALAENLARGRTSSSHAGKSATATGSGVLTRPSGRTSSSHVERNTTAAAREALAVLDARRGEVFAALYSPAGERIWEPCVLAPEALVERTAELAAPPLAGGSGAVRFRSELASRGAEVPGDSDPVHRVAARHVCALAEAAANGGGERLEPIYLRPPDAQRWRERDTSNRAG